MYDEDWNFVEYKYFSSPRYICVIDNNLYITNGGGVIYKTDKYLNLLNLHYSSFSDSSYEGIYCDSKNNLIYAVAKLLQAVHVFDSNLILKDSILTKTYYPYSITKNNKQLYIGASLENLNDGIILVIENKMIVNTIKVCKGNDYITITSILIDHFGLMATTCWIKQIYLHDKIGSYAGNNSLSTLNYQYYIGFDSKGRFVVLTEGQISLYF